jgi:hypothetical protein
MYAQSTNLTIVHSCTLELPTATTVYVLQPNIKEQSEVPFVHYELNMNYGLR